MLLVINRDKLSTWKQSTGAPFYLAVRSPDGNNFVLEALDRRPRKLPNETFIGVSTDRAPKAKLYDFTVDFDNLELQCYSERFPCDQLLIVDDQTLFEYLIDASITERANGDESITSLFDNRLNLSQSSYLEHHSALVKLLFIFRRLTFAKTLIILLLFDTILGAYIGPKLCLWWPTALERAVPEARNVVEWLRSGTPLGLKLNPQVNLALAKFFTCHVSMWNVYVEVILPSLRSASNLIAHIAYIPLTVQCSLICDIVTLSTIHVYCFYGYMCKIYSLWLSSLFALLRIFRGLKWNPLRNRVDSLTDSDPILLCPIILTIVVFLFPTIFLYYVIFSLMRCCVLVVNFLLGTLPHDVMVFVYNLLNSFCGEARLDMRRTDFKRINEYAILAKPSYTRSTGRLISHAIRNVFRLNDFFALCKNLLVGRIVYPL